MSTLVTGAAGFIGANVAKKLKDRGEEIVLVDNFTPYYSPDFKKARVLDLIGNNPEVIPVDIRDFEAMESLFKSKNIDKVIHLAAYPGVRYSLKDPMAYLENNVKATGYLLELARQFEVKHFVFASSASVYGQFAVAPFREDADTAHQISPYGSSKKATELLSYTYSHAFGLPVTALRFFSAAGPWNRPDMAMYMFIKNISNGKPIALFDNGELKRDYTFVEDIADGTIKALDSTPENNFEIYNLGNSKPVFIKDVVSIMEKTIGKKAIIENIPRPVSDAILTHANTERAQRKLNWKPTTNIDEIVQKTVDWFNKFKNIEPY